MKMSELWLDWEDHMTHTYITHCTQAMQLTLSWSRKGYTLAL